MRLKLKLEQISGRCGHLPGKIQLKTGFEFFAWLELKRIDRLIFAEENPTSIIQY